MIGVIHYYDNKDVDLIIEGMEITPDRVKNLVLQNFKTRAVFVGPTAKTNLHAMIGKADRDSRIKALVQRWFDEEVEKNQKVSDTANENGYKFFSLDSDDFEKYSNNVASYLLGNQNF